jgi:hypothetical protein
MNILLPVFYLANIKSWQTRHNCHALRTFANLFLLPIPLAVFDSAADRVHMYSMLYDTSARKAVFENCHNISL